MLHHQCAGSGAVSTYLDGITGSAGENSYFEVSEEYAVGLPEAVHVGAR